MTTVEFNLGGILKFQVAPEARSGAMVSLKYNGFSVTAWGDDMAYALPSGMQVTVRVDYVDVNGNPATVDGPVTWESSNAAVADVHVTEQDSHVAVIMSVGQVGQVQITATADADLGAGVRQLATLMDVMVVAGEAVAGTVSPVGEATPIT